MFLLTLSRCPYPVLSLLLAGPERSSEGVQREVFVRGYHVLVMAAQLLSAVPFRMQTLP
jgi:hypothetical protein